MRSVIAESLSPFWYHNLIYLKVTIFLADVNVRYFCGLAQKHEDMHLLTLAYMHALYAYGSIES